ncbi:hypothetical protein V1280_000556 [Bradyrhizobium sp. AZCC 2230]
MPRPSHCAVSSRVNASKFFYLLVGDSNARIVHVDPNFGAEEHLQPSYPRPPDLVYLT